MTSVVHTLRLCPKPSEHPQHGNGRNQPSVSARPQERRSIVRILGRPVQVVPLQTVPNARKRQIRGRTLRASNAAKEGSLVSDNSADTYNPADLWAEGEFDRLMTVQRGSPPGNLVLTRGQWDWEVREPLWYQLRGRMRFHNTSDRNEIFVAEVEASAVLLGSEARGDSTTCRVLVRSRHPNNDPPARPDGYWRAYITRAKETTDIEVTVDIFSSGKPLHTLQVIRVDVRYVSYGPHGRLPLTQHVVLPLQFPGTFSPSLRQPPPWREVAPGLSVLPVPTHLLCHQDSPLSVLKRYALPHMRTGDTVAIGESPLAIMQGRFRHPVNMTPGLTAKICCSPFHPTSSLATACGMQALVDLVGRLRVILAVVCAVVARLFGHRGMFYRIAGEQSKLIDDLTGTLPPYDQFITLGPLRPQETAEALKAKTGMEVAIVDVNDLQKVDILGASDGLDTDKLVLALTSNPAGNADQQTPLVIVRGCAVSRRFSF